VNEHSHIGKSGMRCGVDLPLCLLRRRAAVESSPGSQRARRPRATEQVGGAASPSNASLRQAGESGQELQHRMREAETESMCFSQSRRRHSNTTTGVPSSRRHALTHLRAPVILRRLRPAGSRDVALSDAMKPKLEISPDEACQVWGMSIAASRWAALPSCPRRGCNPETSDCEPAPPAVAEPQSTRRPRRYGGRRQTRVSAE
jgi:hypothetical protein